MPAKVILKVTKGELADKEFTFDSKEQLFIGRQKDCSIVLPDKSVSRYHCMLEVTPPDVTVRDFGSLNGTFLNGEKIGQRDRSVLAEDGRKEYHEEFELHDGDKLGLSRHCEITLHTVISKLCAKCGEELPEQDMAEADGTIADKGPQTLMNEKGEVICAHCCLMERERAEAAQKRQKAEAAAIELARKLKEAADKAAQEEAEQAVAQKRCADCGAAFTPQAPDNNLCSKCVQDRGKILEAILLQALGGLPGQQPLKDMGPAVVEGFRKVKKLGAGGMGEVWLVQDIKTGKNYALKTMLPQVAANKLAKAAFLREAELGEALEHKNIVKVYRTGSESGVFYILMELCEGGSADKYMERCGGKLPLDVATYIILQVLDGLEYAHQAEISVKLGWWRTRDARGIVHRDFKPANIFLADSGKYPLAKVADFGLSKAFETAGLSKHTRTGTVAGTPVFQPRQQIENFKYSKPDVDVWAAAASYYNMLTANIPKDIKGQDIWLAMYTENPVPIRQRNPEIPEKLAAVIDKALVERPEIGIKSAGEFKRRIVTALPDDVKQAVKGVI